VSEARLLLGSSAATPRYTDASAALLCPAQFPGAPEPLATHDLIGINSILVSHKFSAQPGGIEFTLQDAGKRKTQSKHTMILLYAIVDPRRRSMPALTYLYQMLSTFRRLFARHLPWTLFCAVILGFIGSHHVEAIPSLCRFWHMDETGYHQLLHF